MSSPESLADYDLIGIENPLLDLQIQVPENLLKTLSLSKNTMRLVDETELEALISTFKDCPLHSDMGGAGANTMVTMAQLGSRVVFVGKIGDDRWGQMYREAIDNSGVKGHLISTPGKTGSTVVLVTPDGARTMNTYLGASQTLNVSDVPFEKIRKSRCLYLSAYLLDSPTQQKVAQKAIETAKQENVMVVFNLADPHCVKRHKELLVEVIKSVQLVIGNMTEGQMLTGMNTVEEVGKCLLSLAPSAMITMGEEGAYIASRAEPEAENGPFTAHVPAHQVDVQDTTGAGDAFAGGVMHGILNRTGWIKAAELGIACASAVITQMGARLSKQAAIGLRKMTITNLSP